jgi:hypothetical protein
MFDDAMHTGPGQTRAPKARRKLRWEKAFLKELARVGNVTAACGAADVGRATVYEHADRHPDFKEAWTEALEAAADLLELEARRRAHDGVDVPVLYRGKLCGTWVDAQGQPVAEGTPAASLVPLTIRKYSDALLMFLLRAYRPDKFRDQARRGSKLTEDELERAIEAELARLAEDRYGQERQALFSALGQTLAPYPEAKQAVSALLEDLIAKAKAAARDDGPAVAGSVRKGAWSRPAQQVQGQHVEVAGGQ